MPVAMKESSARRAAENGWPAYIPAFTPPNIGGTEPFTHVKKYFDAYHALLMGAGHSEDTVAAALDWTTHTYQCVHIAESDEQAREELEVILRAYQDAVEREAEFNARAESNAANKKSDRAVGRLDRHLVPLWFARNGDRTPRSVRRTRHWQHPVRHHHRPAHRTAPAPGQPDARPSLAKGHAGVRGNHSQSGRSPTINSANRFPWKHTILLDWPEEPSDPLDKVGIRAGRGTQHRHWTIRLKTLNSASNFVQGARKGAIGEG
jgi:hypothetical protein